MGESDRVLLVLRHAKAVPEVGLRDQDRGLTERGLRDATAAGETLRAAGLVPDRVRLSHLGAGGGQAGGKLGRCRGPRRRTGPDLDTTDAVDVRPAADPPAVSRRIYYNGADIPANVPCMASSPVAAAEDKLRRWAEANAMRDEIVREAAAAGVSIRQIQEITGIARATIIGILARRPKRPLLRLVPSEEPPPR